MIYVKRLFSRCLQWFRRHRHYTAEHDALTDNVKNIFARRFNAMSLPVMTEQRQDMATLILQLRDEHSLPTAVGCSTQFSRNESVAKPLAYQPQSPSLSLFCRAIEPLPEEQRRVLLLRKVYAVSQKDIAQQLHVDEATVEKYLATGLRQCMQYLLKRNEDIHATQVITGCFAKKGD